MKKIISKPLRVSYFIIGAVVDIYSFIQIIRQTGFKMPSLVNSLWFWLFVLVTVAMASLFLYFKWQAHKANATAKLKAVQDELTDYRKRVHEEFCRVYNQINLQQDQINKLSWEIKSVDEKLIEGQNL